MRKGHGQTISYYLMGRTALAACRADQRFSYCCYLPESYEETGTRRYPLAVLVHGSLRDATNLRDQFIDFAEANQCVLLAPLFPCGIEEPGDTHNYKRILYRGIRYDQILLSMIDEIAGLYRLETDKLLMHGFSGGGQFVHRFFYLHPERLAAVSIGAPGVVTLPDPDKPWWRGTGDMKAIFGREPDLAAMRQVAVQMVVGGDDIETWDVTVSPKSSNWMEGINETGATRVERLRSLEAAFLKRGIAVRFDVVPGIEHIGYLVHPPVKDFFGDMLRRRRN
ncbi:hydrolase [Bosea sp. Root670]|uniref:hydrolase n=1 Tax=Bosea sp. Root670 TaxID=1736583 RepID=UPI000714F199|nr:hydrolase [Bosea sp. Root670]KRE03133.1 hydrolase [Bosea sp. Root670]